MKNCWRHLLRRPDPWEVSALDHRFCGPAKHAPGFGEFDCICPARLLPVLEESDRTPQMVILVPEGYSQPKMFHRFWSVGRWVGEIFRKKVGVNLG
jgi:hypothetical protein